MRTTASYIRTILFIGFSIIIVMYIAFPENPLEACKEIWFWAVIALLSLLEISAEICLAAFQSVIYKSLSPEAQKRYDEREIAAKNNWYKKIKEIYKKLLDSRAIEEEHDIILDHNYDGIKELDNNLPPWWLYGFYGTIIFAFVYMIKYHVFDGIDQQEEYEIEMAEAKIAVEEWKKTAKNLVDVNTVTLLTDPGDLAAGKNIFNESCIACHKADGGGGIGPNLTDQYWILGGGIKNVFKTVSEGGRTGKGMVPWKTELKPLEIAQVSSYILSLQGTTPAEPKKAEGDLWVDDNAPEQKQEKPAIDSTVTDSNTADKLSK